MQFGTVGRAVVMTAVASSFVGLAHAAQLRVPGDFSTIQAAINAAANNGDTILVDPGTYAEAINYGSKNIIIRSTSGAAVTTIDGFGLDSSVVTMPGGQNSNSALVGFTITGGTGTLVDGEFVGGGAYLAAPGSVTIRDCVFIANEADLGGGLYISSGFRTKIENSTFENNFALFGGSGSWFTGTTADVTNSTYEGNEGSPIGSGAGAGIASSNVKFIDTVFSNNLLAVSGGGIYIEDCFSTTVDGCTFLNNSATRVGGAIDILGFSAPVIRNSAFDGNSATRTGGAIQIESDVDGVSGTVKVYNNVISNNEALNESGGGIYVADGATTIAGCEIYRNTADQDGGGVFFDAQGVPLNMVNCTVALNAIPETSANYGGGVYGENDPPLQVVNTIFSDNVGSTSIVFANIGYRGTTATRPVLEYCLNDGFFYGTNNINDDPAFTNPANNDFSLTFDSPAIDAGDTTRVPSDLTTDIDGDIRAFDQPSIPNTGVGSPPVDIGADEVIEIPPFSLSVFPAPRAGRTSDFIISQATPNENVFLAYSTRGLGSQFVPQLNVTLDLRQPAQAGNPKRADQFGNATITIPFPSNSGGRDVWFQACQVERISNVLERTVRQP